MKWHVLLYMVGDCCNIFDWLRIIFLSALFFLSTKLCNGSSSFAQMVFGIYGIYRVKQNHGIFTTGWVVKKLIRPYPVPSIVIQIFFTSYLSQDIMNVKIYYGTNSDISIFIILFTITFQFCSFLW